MPVRSKGVHLDHGRKYYGGAWIVRLLQRMAELNLTELQLNLSENSGYRLVSARRPEIVSREHLTRDEIRVVRAAANELGISIVPSLDMPGHMGHVLKHYPELALSDGARGVVPQAIDLDLDASRALIDDLHADIAELFPDAAVWHIGFDEIVPVDAPETAAGMTQRARDRFGKDSVQYDLVTQWANEWVARLADRCIRSRLWNDSLFRSRIVELDTRAEVTWWTAWSEDFASLATALDRGHRVVNCNDSVLYYVLGEAAGCAYPTPARLRESGWHPGVFPTRPDGTEQLVDAGSPQVVGSLFCIWSDLPDAQSPEEVLAAIDAPLTEYAQRA